MGSGSVDGVAKLFNLQAGKTVGTFACGGGGSSSQQKVADDGAAAAADAMDEDEAASNTGVESIVFPKGEQSIFITGCLDGVVNVWDIPSQVSEIVFLVSNTILDLVSIGVPAGLLRGQRRGEDACPQRFRLPAAGGDAGRGGEGHRRQAGEGGGRLLGARTAHSGF